MFKLMKLEIKKFKIKGNILGAIICNICLLGLVSAIFFVERSEGNNPFSNYDMAFNIICQLICATFVVFAAYLISKFMIEEYKTKTINLLFTYPINRKKIMISKVLIISIFTFISIVISTIIVFSGFYGIQCITNTTIGEITSTLISQLFLKLLLTAFINSIIALVPLYFGIKKRSTPITLITSFLTMIILYSGNNDINLYSIIAIPIVFMIAGIVIVYLTIRDIDKKDILV